MTVEYMLYTAGKQSMERIITVDDPDWIPQLSELVFFREPPKPPVKYAVMDLEWNLDPTGIYSCQVILVRI